MALDGKISTRSKKPYKVILIDNRTTEEKKNSLAQVEIIAKNAAHRKVWTPTPRDTLK